MWEKWVYIVYNENIQCVYVSLKKKKSFNILANEVMIANFVYFIISTSFLPKKSLRVCFIITFLTGLIQPTRNMI